ncbi:MAG: hypothetical protein ACE5HU_07655 [Acidobacteriota bacterium]
MVRRRLSWLLVYSAAMAFVESAVVVYLRQIYYPGGFSFPIVIIPDRLSAIEVGREAATLLMLLAVSFLVGSDRWERFLAFCFCFGVWDIFYYVWLWVFLRWPPSLLTWDILFLIPVPWIGPVLAPVLVSISLVAGSVWLLRARERGARLAFPLWQWGLATAGGIGVLLSFMLDWPVVLDGREPPPFRWWLFCFGLALGVSAVGFAARTMAPVRRERIR